MVILMLVLFNKHLKQPGNFIDVVECDLTLQRDMREVMTLYALYDIPVKSPGDFLALQATVVNTDIEN